MNINEFLSQLATSHLCENVCLLNKFNTFFLWLPFESVEEILLCFRSINISLKPREQLWIIVLWTAQYFDRRDFIPWWLVLVDPSYHSGPAVRTIYNWILWWIWSNLAIPVLEDNKRVKKWCTLSYHLSELVMEWSEFIQSVNQHQADIEEAHLDRPDTSCRSYIAVTSDKVQIELLWNWLSLITRKLDIEFWRLIISGNWENVEGGRKSEWLDEGKHEPTRCDEFLDTRVSCTYSGMSVHP